MSFEHLQACAELGLGYIARGDEYESDAWAITVNGVRYEIGNPEDMDVYQAIDAAKALLAKLQKLS